MIFWDRRINVLVIQFTLPPEVFIAAFCGFAAMAHCLFSPYAAEFATYERSLFSTFKVIQDDFDWPVVREGGRLPGMIWNTSFVVVISYLMLNMLLSIVMDTYVEVKGRTGHAETLFSQGRETFRRYHQAHRGIRVTLRHIVNCLDQRYPGLNIKIQVIRFFILLHRRRSRLYRRRS